MWYITVTGGVSLQDILLMAWMNYVCKGRLAKIITPRRFL